MDIYCLIPSNPDVAGVGVRFAIYFQSFLCFIPALIALLDFRITTYELESIETQSTTNLILAFAILISCGVQAFTLGLTNYHANIVLSMSWINNTNAFVYFVLYVHYKAKLADGPGETPVKPQWIAWRTHVKSQLRAFLHLSDGSERQGFGTGTAEGNETNEDQQVKKSSAKILFGRVALFMGSLHLTIMSGLGIWLWSDIRSFGASTSSSCATDYLSVSILGASVPFTSNSLRVISLSLYSLFLLPGFNLLLPMTLFLGFFIWHHSRYVAVAPRSTRPETRTLASPGPLPARRAFTTPLANVYTACIKSSIFPVCVGLAFLLAVNIIFITDIELTLRRNKDFQASGEAEWGFGQVLAVLLLVMPLRDVVEMILARRQRRQEMQIKDHEWKSAIFRRNINDIIAMVRAGSDPNVKAGGYLSALEVASVTEHWEGVQLLVDRGSDVNVMFTDGRTALHAAVSHKRWDLVPKLVDEDSDLTSKPANGQTALELALIEENWECVDTLVDATGQAALEVLSISEGWAGACILVEKGAVDVNKPFKDGRTALEVAFCAGKWTLIQALIGKNADIKRVTWPAGNSLETWAQSPQRAPAVRSFLLEGPNADVPFPEGQTLLEVSTKVEDWDGVHALALSKFDVNIAFTDGCTVLEAAFCARKWDVMQAVIKAGADVNKEFKGLDPSNTRTPLQRAYFEREAPTGILELMLEAGADPNIPDGLDGSTCLHNACFQLEEREDVVSLLVKYGANPDISDFSGCTPLYSSCVYGHARCIQILLDAGANMNLQGPNGWTPLHLACLNGRINCVKVLLEHGADTSIKNSDDKTAFQIALEENRLGVVKLFRSHGAVDTSDNGLSSVAESSELSRQSSRISR